MRKLLITCDCCHREIEERDAFCVDHYVHVSPEFDRLNGHVKSVDGQMYSISGRTECKDFCLPCYNRLFYQFFAEIKEYQKKTKTI